MENTDQIRPFNFRRVSLFLFIVGVFIGMLLIGFSVYADFESTLFDLSTTADNSVRPITCPVLLSNNEVGTFSAVIKNSDDQSRELVVRAHISQGHLILMREIQDKVALDPNQSQLLTWEVTAQDAVYNHLVLAKVIVLDANTGPSHKGSCGMIVLNLPGSVKGWQVYWLLFTMSFSGVLSGMITWWKYGRAQEGRELEARRSILGLGGLVLVGLVTISLGFWEIAAGAFYVSLLLIGVIVPHFLIAR